MYKPDKEEDSRVEFRSPDPACNPYLAFSVMLAAGLEGVKKEYKLPEPIEQNIYLMSEEEKRELGIVSLPGSLIEAIQLTEKSKLVRETLGDHVFNSFIASKKVEWDDYRKCVHPYEIKQFLPIL